MSKPSKFVILIGLVCIFTLSACGPGAPPEAVEVEQATPSEPEPTQPPPPTNTPVPTPTPAPPTETPLPTETPTPAVQLSGLSPDPQRVEFQAEDGKNLVGYYYPSRYADSPVVVLMHWVVGDLCDWRDIATWLQNRADENPAVLERCVDIEALWTRGDAPWWDSSWFPPMPEGASFAVFTFDFRDFGESQAGLGAPSEWARDAVAAYQTAAGMEANLRAQNALQGGIKLVAQDLQEAEPVPVVGGGSSIAADAVVTAIYRAIREQMANPGAEVAALDIFPGILPGYRVQDAATTARYAGAFSWSPGNYLDNDYAAEVKYLAELETPIPVWCLAGEEDYSAGICEQASAYLDRKQIYPDTKDHGNFLISPFYDPNSLVLFLEFLEMTVGFEP
ncbi:MAG: hypothetical protein AB1801_19760 [Chloroflexota bacterium]